MKNAWKVKQLCDSASWSAQSRPRAAIATTFNPTTGVPQAAVDSLQRPKSAELGREQTLPAQRWSAAN